MESAFLNCYAIISLFMAAADTVLAVKAFRKNNRNGKYLGLTCVGAAIVDISYLGSILGTSYRFTSVMSSIYFSSIDVTLVCLLTFTTYYTRRNFTGPGRKAMGFVLYYMLFEILVFAVNPFREIAVSYLPRDTFIAKYTYEMKPLYWAHLCFTYFLVLAILLLLLRKMDKIPREYRNQYRFIIIGIMLIVMINAVFLFLPGVSLWNLLDYSICGYSLIAFLLYWSCFDYSTHGMLNRLKSSIFKNIGQGLVLFDYHDNLILHNERAEYLLGGSTLEKDTVLEDFLKQYNITLDPKSELDSYSQQCYIKDDTGIRPLRCDIRRLKNEQEEILGLLFVFSDAALETDLLTGFQNWESFRKFAGENPGNFTMPTAVAICDINSLSVINSKFGHHIGDQKIRQLADAMRKCFPGNTYYVRGHEANLIGLCSLRSEKEMHRYLEKVKKIYPENIQYAVSITTEQEPDVLAAIRLASKGMRAKKLLDQESIHSEMLTSLIRALQECDSDTESHVRRTQIMGAKLGSRIGLTDIQQSALSLLCLLHDIGKIGVPLEILNKPGKLSEEEWKILQTHTEKGYEIANSNTELQGIAEEIRHHHERWDGKGYPDGLREEKIPLLSRVIAVVDAHDAMVNTRSYRAARPQSEAIAELKRCAGTQFDPFIVEQFLQLLEEEPAETDALPVNPAASGKNRKYTVLRSRTKNDQDSKIHPVPYSRYTLDGNGMIVYADEHFTEITGYTKEDLVEKNLSQIDLIPQEEQADYFTQASEHLAKNPLIFLEHSLRRKDGRCIQVFCFGRLYFDSAVREERSEIIITAISNSGNTGN